MLHADSKMNDDAEQDEMTKTQVKKKKKEKQEKKKNKQV